MEIVKMAIDVREKIGSAESRRLRNAGRLPIVLYGMGRDTKSFTIDSHTFELEFHKGRRMFELSLGDLTQVSLLKAVGFNELGDQPVHADFIRIDDTKPVKISVALEFIGVPAPTAGAVVDYVNRDIHVTCLPREIPESIPVKLGHLTVGHHIEARQIEMPAGVTLIDPPGRTIVSYHYKAVEQVAVPVEGAPAEPVVLTEKKLTDEEKAAAEKAEKDEKKK